MLTKFQFPKILIGVLLTVAIFGMGMVFESSLIPSPQAEHTTQSEQQSDNKSESNSIKTQSLWTPTDSIGLYTLVLAVFTGVLAAVSIFQCVMLLRADKTTRLAALA